MLIHTLKTPEKLIYIRSCDCECSECKMWKHKEDTEIDLVELLMHLIQPYIEGIHQTSGVEIHADNSVLRKFVCVQAKFKSDAIDE